MLDMFKPVNLQWADQPPRKLVMRAPISAESTIELYTLGKALDLRGLQVLREYLDLMEKGLRLTPSAEPVPAQQPGEGEE